nr:site-specific DNA-methyltransferase [Bacillota bacterium]
MPFFEYENIRIFNDDFVASHCLPDSSIDLIVTSPPYNVKIDYNSYD